MKNLFSKENYIEITLLNAFIAEIKTMHPILTFAIEESSFSRD